MSTTMRLPAQPATVEETADLLRLNPQTVRAKLRSGEFRGVRIGNGPNAHWRIPAGELQRLTGGITDD